jgi:hypothetical protein
MRPVPPISTDLLYSDFPKEDLVEIGNALDVSDIKYITTATLRPERLFYHACLNGIQTYVKLKSSTEVERAREIAQHTDALYQALLPAFMEKAGESQPQLAQKCREATQFCEQLHAIEGARPWNDARYKATWNTNDYPPRWQKKAIETYGQIRNRIENGHYTPKSGDDAGSLTRYWSLRNLEYKHYRDIARSLVEEHIAVQYPKEDLLTMHPADNRTMTMFIGGMGSGKSAMTEYFLGQLPGTERADTVLHNADHLKYALYKSAAKDGVLPKDHRYVGAEIQAESSNALYEGTRKRAYLARQKFQAPNVVLNSIVLGSFEVQEGIASGGKIIAHHVHISPEEAISEAEKRRVAIDGRIPSDEDIRWSAKASANSLLLLTQPEYRGTDVIVHLYQRAVDKAPHHYATIDAAKKILTIYDQEAFEALAKTAEDTAFQKRFSDAGYAIMHEKTHTIRAASKQGDIYAAM